MAYPWRNSAASPLRQKGCHVTRHEGADGRTLLVGVGYFGDECGGGGDEAAVGCPPGGALGSPPPVPPSRAAARAATARLKRLLDEADATSAVATQAAALLAHSPTHHLLAHSLARSLTRSPTHPPTHSLTASLAHSRTARPGDRA